MRELARFADQQAAETLSGVLYVEGIDNTIHQSRDGQHVVWVHEETALERARGLLAEFEASPGDPRLVARAREAEALRRQKEKEEARGRHRVIEVRRNWSLLQGVGPVSLVLILASVAVALFTQLGEDKEAVRHFTFASFHAAGGEIRWARLHDILHGQVYRVFTPILVHFGVTHLFFNLWWLKDLGTQIERRQSSWLLIALVVVIAGASNTAQYFVGGPYFGGMSGVVYGLFGYIWFRGQFDPRSGYAMPPASIGMMMIWFALCFTGLIGPIANAAHTVGLLAGALWGFLSSGQLRRWLSRGGLGRPR